MTERPYFISYLERLRPTRVLGGSSLRRLLHGKTQPPSPLSPLIAAGARHRSRRVAPNHDDASAAAAAGRALHGVAVEAADGLTEKHQVGFPDEAKYVP